jgi:hypothetical protein
VEAGVLVGTSRWVDGVTSGSRGTWRLHKFVPSCFLVLVSANVISGRLLCNLNSRITKLW